MLATIRHCRGKSSYAKTTKVTLQYLMYHIKAPVLATVKHNTTQYPQIAGKAVKQRATEVTLQCLMYHIKAPVLATVKHNAMPTNSRHCAMLATTKHCIQDSHFNIRVSKPESVNQSQ